MLCKNSQFQKLMISVQEVFSAWETEFLKFRDSVKFRKNFDIYQSHSIFEHTALKERCEIIMKKKREHEKIKELIQNIFLEERRSKQSYDDLLHNLDINEAYKAFNNVDALDLSKEGDQIFH